MKKHKNDGFFFANSVSKTQEERFLIEVGKNAYAYKFVALLKGYILTPSNIESLLNSSAIPKIDILATGMPYSIGASSDTKKNNTAYSIAPDYFNTRSLKIATYANRAVKLLIDFSNYLQTRFTEAKFFYAGYAIAADYGRSRADFIREVDKLDE
jgi:hypothetical protein